MIHMTNRLTKTKREMSDSIANDESSMSKWDTFAAMKKTNIKHTSQHERKKTESHCGYDGY